MFMLKSLRRLICVDSEEWLLKKVIPLAFLILGTLSIAYFLMSNPLNKNSSLKLYDREGLSAEQVATYRVSLQAVQKSLGQPDKIISNIEGSLKQFEQGPADLVSQWSEITKLAISGQQATEAEIVGVTSHPTVSRVDASKSYRHYFASEFPQRWFRLQLNFLQRGLVFPPEKVEASYRKHETEEMGDYWVEYSVRERGHYRELKKTFISYDNPQIVMDRSDNAVHYILSPAGRLISAQGDLSFVHHAAGGDRFTVSLKVELVAVGPKPKLLPVDVSQMEVADASKLRMVARENRIHDTIGFDQAMALLPRVTPSTDGRDISLIFSALKFELRARSERANELREFILATKGRDEGSKRQLAAAFGALAQSDQSSIADLLANLVRLCSDVFCKDQAIVALNDHSSPTVDSGRKMLDIVKNQPDYDTAAAAVLAVGSIAHKIGDQIPEVPLALIAAYYRPENAKLKRSLLAAMGNHGDNEYLPILKESLLDRDSSVRGTAFYSLRHLKDEGVDEILTTAIEGEQSNSAVNEGLKAAFYRQLSSASYERIATRLAGIQKQEEAKEATRLFMRIYERQADSMVNAMVILQEKSRHSVVKAVIARRLEDSSAL